LHSNSTATAASTKAYSKGTSVARAISGGRSLDWGRGFRLQIERNGGDNFSSCCDRRPKKRVLDSNDAQASATPEYEERV
ncbi:unnamed protein product, partial [Pylaiella littoralis]